jgi:hypothetical protein
VGGEWILKEGGGGGGGWSLVHDKGEVTGSCECGNEDRGSTK